MTNKNTIKLYHEKTAKGTLIQHIIINGIEMSGRTITSSDNYEIVDGFLNYLNGLAQEELEENPDFFWPSLKDWRSWASSKISDYNKQVELELENKLIDSIKNK